MSDICDRAAELEMLDRDHALAAQARRGIRPVNAQGRCRDCGEAIDPRRLAFDPTVARCIDCQSMHEQRGRR